jgi:protein-glucosylgalactosylhydroxylysine glucosidase
MHNSLSTSGIVILLCLIPPVSSLIDRKAVVMRHNPQLELPISQDSLSSLGNGAFSFNIDVTGLQSLNSSYEAFDLNTLSDWAWHTSFVGIDALRSYNYSTYNTTISNGNVRTVRYPTGYNATPDSGAWLHNNPHKMPLAQISLAWQMTYGIGDATLIKESDIVNASQTLDSWTGSSLSVSTLQSPKGNKEDISTLTEARVLTTVHPIVDALAIRVELSSQASSNPIPLVLRIAFPYALSGAADWLHDLNHTSQVIINEPGRIAIQRSLDSDGYRVDCSYNSSWTIEFGEPAIPRHVFLFLPPINQSIASTDLVCLFAPRNNVYPIGKSSPWLIDKSTQTQALQDNGVSFTYDDVALSAANMWEDYWNEGAFVDLSGASGGTKADAFELERRVVRSLYLLRALEAGAEPPAETGLLLAGNWAGKHHGEMRWWHQAWSSYWNRSDFLSRSDLFYADYLINATSVAAAQGYSGARWPKMTASVCNRSANNEADVPWIGLEYAPLPSSVNGGNVESLGPLLLWESSSGVGPLLVWQQSHSILLSEAQRRLAAASGGATAALAIMNRLAPIVFATADFLASFVVPDANGTFHLYPPLFGGEESGNPLEISDPAFELIQINNALDTASAWRDALGLSPVIAWENVRGNVASPPLDPATSSPPLYANNAACACLYAPSGTCSFARPGCPRPLVSHPMTSGLHGMLNGLGGDQGVRYKVTVESLNATTAAVLSNWSWGNQESSANIWGWTPPFVSLSLSRLSYSPETIIDTLLLNVNKNLYNRQGANQGMGNLTIYFPGNGGTLLAVAAMASGFDGGAPGDQLRKDGPGAIAINPTRPVGFPSSWGAVVEGFNVPLT